MNLFFVLRWMKYLQCCFKQKKKSPTHILILIIIKETAFEIFAALLFPKGVSCNQFCNVFANGKGKNYAVARDSFRYTLKRYKFMITMKPLGGHLVGICLFVTILLLRWYIFGLRSWWKPSLLAWCLSWSPNKKTAIRHDRFHVVIFNSVYSDR